MPPRKKPPYVVRPATSVLTRGFDPRLSVGSVRPPVFRSSTYAFASPESAERAFAIALGKVQPTDGENVDLIYSRLSHPNAEILEDQIVPLEPGATSAAVFNSGMAAISTIFLTFCHPGSTFIHTSPVYGGTAHFMRQVLEPLGMRGTSVPAGDGAALAAAIERAVDLAVVFIETPANPTMRMTDIAAAAVAAKKRAEPALVVVDNTLLGPVFQHPLRHGADLVVYSATKFLAGFSDMLGGVVLCADPHLVSALGGARAMLGNILQADECWLLNSRLCTVELRMSKQSKNAKKIVDGLVGHPKIVRIHHPSLFVEPDQIRIRDAQSRYPGSLFALELGSKRSAFELLRRLRVIHDAVSLGGAESLACHPATTTHSEMTPQELESAGVTNGLVRVSVGVEDWRDLLRDLKDAADAL